MAIDEEEVRARVKAFADATGSTMAECGEGMRRLTGFLAAGVHSMSELAALRDDGEG